MSACLSRSALLLPLPLIYALGGLTFIKVAQPGPETVRLLLWGALVPVAVLLVGALSPLVLEKRRYRGSLALDRYHGLEDRVTNALAFSREREPTPLMEAAIGDALEHAERLRPARAVPLRIPRDFLLSAALVGCLYGVSLLEVRTTRVLRTEVSDFEPVVLNADDVELLREASRELERGAEDPEVTAAVRRFNQLVEDIAERRLDRRQIFERLDNLEQSLAGADEGLEAALDEGLSDIARELEKSGSTKPIAEALQEQKLADAEQAIKELAERLKKKPSQVNKAELERIRKALEAASKQSAERVANIERERRELEEGKQKLLQKKNKGEKLSKSEQKKLDDTERQLKRLDRKKKDADKASEELSQLDKDLAKAAEELMKELGQDQAAQQMEKVAEEINRVAQKKMSKEEKEALKKQLEELRQMLRQQKQGGQKRDEALERFRQMARGQKPGQGQGDKGAGQGQGQQPGGGTRIALGQGQGAGAEIPMPGSGQGASPGTGANGEGSDPGSGQNPGGEQWGTGSTEDIQGEATSLEGQTEDVSAAGIDSGEGEASVEVVYGAAERGFTGRGYKKVYTDYKTVAEEVLAQDEIPPGYQFFVRRYFQLIRPRD